MEEPRIGVYICWCGSNIAKMVDVQDVAKFISKLPGVIIARDYKYMCSDPGQEMVIKDIKEFKLNRVVVSACSPRIHELTFRKALENAGLNPYMFEMANIREQDSWVHENRVEATHKAKSLVAAAVYRVKHHEALDKRSVDINPATLIIGGGIAGMSAALEIANAGKKVFLIEKSAELGGNLARVDLTFPYLYSARQILQPIIQQVLHHPDISVFFNTRIDEVYGYVGNFETTLKNQNGRDLQLKFGNVIVATGLKPFDPSVIPEYNYGKLADVVTSHELEQMLSNGRILTRAGKVPKHIAIIHCVGSRNPKYHPYCSRTCCLTALKYSNQIRSMLPGAKIYQLYADMRAMGKGCEELYAHTSRQGVMFLMFDQKKNLPRVRKADTSDSCNLVIEMDELLSGETVEIPADLVILMVNMEAHDDAADVAHAV